MNLWNIGFRGSSTWTEGPPTPVTGHFGLSLGLKEMERN